MKFSLGDTVNLLDSGTDMVRYEFRRSFLSRFSIRDENAIRAFFAHFLANCSAPDNNTRRLRRTRSRTNGENLVSVSSYPITGEKKKTKIKYRVSRRSRVFSYNFWTEFAPSNVPRDEVGVGFYADSLFPTKPK